MPNIDNSALERLAIGASDSAEDVSVRRPLLENPDDGSSVRLSRDSSAVERSENG